MDFQTQKTFTSLTLLFAALLSAHETRADFTAEVEEDFADVFDEEFISIATGTQQPLTEAPAVASVITADEIAAMGAATLEEVLETVPGLHVSLSTNRLNAIYSIRGIYTNQNPQILVLLNGTAIQQQLIGHRGEHFSINTATIKRIEVIRGPGSAIYGADAFSGVINIVTKTSEDISGTEIGVRSGSFDGHDAWLQYGNTHDQVDVYFSLSYKSTNGDDDRIIKEDAQSSWDAGFETSASRAPRSADTEKNIFDVKLDITHQNWRFEYWNMQLSNLGLGSGLALALDPDGEYNSDYRLFKLSYENFALAPDWSLSANTTYFEYDIDSRQTLFPADTVLPIGEDGNINPIAPVNTIVFPNGLIGNPGLREEQLGIEIVSLYEGFTQHKLRFAIGARKTKIRGTEEKNFGPGVIDDPANTDSVDGTLTTTTGTRYNFIQPKDRTLFFLSFQDEWKFMPDWNFTAGIRYDDYSDFGNTVNPRLALVWLTTQKLTSKALYGRAFRAPSFSENFLEHNPVLLGNEGVDPETIDTLEVVFDYQPNHDIRYIVNMYHYDIDDLIEYTPDANATTLSAKNVGTQQGYGLEWEVNWKVNSNWALSGSYAYQNIDRSNSSSENSKHAPRHQVYLSSRWDLVAGWTFFLENNNIFDRKRFNADPRNKVDNYSLFNASIRFSNFKRFAASLTVRNIFDEEGFEPTPYTPGVPQGSLVPGDFPIEGRNIRAELQYSF